MLYSLVEKWSTRISCLGYFDKVFEVHPGDDVVRPEATITEMDEYGSDHEITLS